MIEILSDVPQAVYTTLGSIAVSTFIAFRLIIKNNRRNASYELIHMMFSEELRSHRTALANHIEKRYPQGERISFKSLNDEYFMKTESFGSMSLLFFFERIYVMYKIHAVDRRLLWVCVGRQLCWWHENFLSRLEVDVNIVGQHDHVARLAKKISRIIEIEQNTFLVKLGINSRTPWSD